MVTGSIFNGIDRAISILFEILNFHLSYFCLVSKGIASCQVFSNRKPRAIIFNWLTEQVKSGEEYRKLTVFHPKHLFLLFYFLLIQE